MKRVLKVAKAVLAIGIAIWGVVSFAEILMHSNDYLTTGVHYTYDNSNMWICLFDAMSKILKIFGV